MGRGVSSGGGQSSLGYLFGSEEGTKVSTTSMPNPAPGQPPLDEADNGKQIPAGIKGGPCSSNNYFRAEGQNCGNFITDRPSTKVHSAPGGGSSLDYLFGDGNK